MHLSVKCLIRFFNPLTTDPEPLRKNDIPTSDSGSAIANYLTEVSLQ